MQSEQKQLLVGRICRRDGEQPCYIEFSGVRIELGLSELRTLFGCALIELGNASGSTRRVLENPMQLLVDACQLAIAIAIPPSSTDAEANRARWEATGIGGVTDLEELRACVAKWNDKLRGLTMEEFRKLQRESNGHLC